MKVFESVKELRAELDKAEQSGIGFVPTMAPCMQDTARSWNVPGGKTAPSW